MTERTALFKGMRDMAINLEHQTRVEERTFILASVRNLVIEWRGPAIPVTDVLKIIDAVETLPFADRLPRRFEEESL